VFNFHFSNGKKAGLPTKRFNMKLLILDLAGRTVRRVQIFFEANLNGFKFFD